MNWRKIGFVSSLVSIVGSIAIYAFCSIELMTYPERKDALTTIADIFNKDLPLGKVKLERLNGRFLDSKIP